MDEKTVSFEDKLTGLLDLAKKKKNVLENREILDFFRGEILGPDKLDKIYEFLDNNQIDVLRMDDEEREIMISVINEATGGVAT